MDSSTAKNALLFLHRVHLSGQEVPAFITVVRAIEGHAAANNAPAQPHENDLISAGAW